jgi:hypothetical protein
MSTFDQTALSSSTCGYSQCNVACAPVGLDATSVDFCWFCESMDTHYNTSKEQKQTIKDRVSHVVRLVAKS